MRIIEIDALPNGAHNNQYSFTAVEVPAGWAIIPDDMELPETFPFVNVTASQGVVTKLTPGVVPPPEPVTPQPTADDILNALLGVTE
jgi:hypothetical protein